MKSLKILIGLFTLSLVFSLTNATAMEKSSLNLNKNENMVNFDEESVPIQIKPGDDGIIFNLSDEKVAKQYKNENVCDKREVEQWLLNGVVIHNKNLNYNRNSCLYHTEKNSLHTIEFLLKNFVRRFKNSVIDQFFDELEGNATAKSKFIILLYNLFERCEFYLRYDDFYNFKYTRKFNKRVVILFDGMTKEEKEIFETLKNSQRENSKNMENLEDIRILRRIRAFLQVFMDIFFYENERIIPSLIKQEYSMSFDVPERFLFCSEKVNNEIMPYIMNNIENEGVKFNGEDKDFEKFYRLAYNRVLNIDPEKTVMLTILLNSNNKFKIDLYKPANVEYVKISNDWLKATFKFKENEDVIKELFYLLKFELRSFDDPGAVVAKKIILSYINRMKEKKLEEEKIKKENEKEELEEENNKTANEFRKTEYEN